MKLAALRKLCKPFNSLQSLYSDSCRRRNLSWALETLGVKATTNIKTVRNIYYTEAKKCHPDASSCLSSDPLRFSNLAEAYSIICERNEQTLSTKIKSQEVLNYNSHVWARLFYGTIEREVSVDADIIEALCEASKLSAGGLDKEGLWELATTINANVSSLGSGPQESSISVVKDDGDPTMGFPIDQSPKPASRRKI